MTSFNNNGRYFFNRLNFNISQTIPFGFINNGKKFFNQSDDIISFTFAMILSGSSMAPMPKSLNFTNRYSVPMSPHTSFFSIGGMTVTTPNPETRVIWSFVRGCSHMAVFMAGQRTKGFLQSQARKMHVYQFLILMPLPYEQVVAYAAGHLCKCVCIQRCHYHQISPLSQLNMQDRITTVLPNLSIVCIIVIVSLDSPYTPFILVG